MKKMKNVWLKVQICLLTAVSMSVSSCGDLLSSEESRNHLHYLAVQIEKDNNWSIMDGDGKIVVKEEYPKDNMISEITKSGVYWVRADKKYSLYSVDSPKKPLTSVEYDDVTTFADDRAFVSVFGEPIQMIDESGTVIKTLSEDISEVWTFAEGLAVFKSKDKYGYLDTKGNTKIKAQYDGAGYFSEGKAIVSDENLSNSRVIDKKGKVMCRIDSPYIAPFGFHDDVILAVDWDNGCQIQYFDENGKVAVKPSKKIKLRGLDRIDQSFFNGIAVAYNEEEEPGLIDKNGEFLIRCGKNKTLNHIAEGMIIASNQNEKFGVIDKDENIIVPFEYTDAGMFFLGDYFILGQGSTYMLVDREGKEVKKSDFSQWGGFKSTHVTFVNVKANIKAITELFTTDGYKPLKGKDNAPAIAKELNLNLDEFDTYCRIASKDMKVGDWDATVEVWTDGCMKTARYHTEVQNDGWFSHEKQVFDGYGWDPEARLEKVRMQISVPSGLDMEQFVSMVKEQFVKNGFKESGEVLYITKGSKTYSIMMYTDENVLHLTYLLSGVVDSND